MDHLASLGIILLFALLVGELAKLIRVPEVTGYILAGVLVGPSGAGWISHEHLGTLEIFSEVALGLILFSIGSNFEFGRMRAIGSRVLRITLVESPLSAALVAGGMLLFGQPWTVAVLLGIISMETAAATTLMVIRENDAEGPMTDTLQGIIGVNNVLTLVGFLLFGAVMELTGAAGGAQPKLYEALYPPVWQLVGAAALGFLIGLTLASWIAALHGEAETLILVAGCVLLCVGAAKMLEVSPLIASLSVGATMVNLTDKSRRFFTALAKTDPPLYAIFFVIAGADLNLSLLASLGMLGFVYVAGRALGKVGGSSLVAGKAGLPGEKGKMLGFSLLAQAGLAIGLVLTVDRRFPDIAPIVSTVVLAAVAVFEIVGPLSVRFALVRSGEARPAQAAEHRHTLGSEA